MTTSTLPGDITLEIFGQQPSAALVTPFLFCYRMNETIDVQRIVRILETGRQLLHRDFPWTSGQVIQDLEDDLSGQRGVFKIRHTTTAPSVIVKDLRTDPSVASMQDLITSGFPTHLLDEQIFSPVTVLPTDEPTQPEARNQVLTIQVNLIRGGLLLNFVGHHQAIDGTGQDLLAGWFNEACHGRAIAEEEIRLGNLPRENIVELFGDEWQPSKGSPYLKKPATTSTDVKSDLTTPDLTTSPPLIWTNISFSGEALSELKSEASIGLKAGGGYVSTDDALTAFIWQSISRARAVRLPMGTRTTLGRAVNPRRYLDIPPSYPGYISNFAYTTMSLGTVTQSSLSAVAASLRAAVDPRTSGLGDSTREYATLLHRAEDKDSIALGNCLDLDHDLMLSSWMNMRSYEFDFGMGLGPPIAFRRPLMAPVPSLAFLLPKDPSGGVVLNVCIREDDLARMQQDSLFTRFGRFIG
jgi:hypothetical protein